MNDDCHGRAFKSRVQKDSVGCGLKVNMSLLFPCRVLRICSSCTGRFQHLLGHCRFTIPLRSWRPNHSYTGGKSDGCSKVSSQTQWAIPRGPHLSCSPVVGMGRSVTASPFPRALVRPPRWGQCVVQNIGGIRHGKEKSPTTRIDGV